MNFNLVGYGSEAGSGRFVSTWDRSKIYAPFGFFTTVKLD